jgi:hypothetical protein
MTLPWAGGSVTIGGPTYPLIVLTCMQCGYTVHVNAIVAGVVPRPHTPEQPAATQETPPAETASPGGEQKTDA